MRSWPVAHSCDNTYEKLVESKLCCSSSFNLISFSTVAVTMHFSIRGNWWEWENSYTVQEHLIYEWNDLKLESVSNVVYFYSFCFVFNLPQRSLKFWTQMSSGSRTDIFVVHNWSRQRMRRRFAENSYFFPNKQLGAQWINKFEKKNLSVFDRDKWMWRL